MAQHSEEVEINRWTRVNLADGGEFRAKNKSGHQLRVMWSAVDISAAPVTQAQLEASWDDIEPDDYFQRIPEAGTMDAYVTLVDQVRYNNSAYTALISVIEP